MKICTADGSYLQRYGFERGIARIAELGFQALDYQRFCDTDTPLFQEGEQAFEQQLKNHRKFFEQCGLEVNQTHGPWRWPICDFTTEDRAERFEKMSRSIWGTAILGCDKMVIHPIMPFGDEEGLHTREMWEMNVEFMGRLCEVGRQNGVVVCLENMPFRCQSTSTPEAIVRLVKLIGGPFCKICLDTGHSLVMGVQPAVAVRQIGGELLACLHVHDNNGEHDWHWLPYTGKGDWDAFAEALHEIGYQGALSLETGIPSGIPEELAPLQEQSLVQMVRRMADLAERQRATPPA